MNSIVNESFYHPMNKTTKGSQRLFDHNRGLISSKASLADAQMIAMLAK